MIACPERATADFVALDMYNSAVVVLIFSCALVTRARTSMTTRQSNATGCRTTKSVVEFLRALHLNSVTAARNRLANHDLTLHVLEGLCPIARYFIFKMAARESHVANADFASSAVLSTSRLLASMTAGLVLALAWLFTPEHFVHGARVAPRLTTMSAVRKTIQTRLSATTFGTELRKVVWLLDVNWCAFMPRTAELQGWTDMILGAQQVDDLLPHWNVGISVGIANDIHAMLSSAEKHIDAVLGLEETNFAVFVASDQRDYDDLGFFALKVVDSGHTKKITQLFLLQWLSLGL